VFLLPNLARMLAEGDNVTKGYSQCGRHLPAWGTSQTTARKTDLVGTRNAANSVRAESVSWRARRNNDFGTL